MISQFWDEPQGCFYDTGRDHEELVVRPRDVFDNAQPCGGSVASDLLLRLSVVTGNEDYAAKAVAPLRSLAELMGRAPAGTGRWLAALDFYLSTPKEVAVIGPPDDPATPSLLREVNGRYIANRVVVGASGQDSAAPASGLPLLEGRGMVDGKPTAYVCENYACQLPVTDAESLAGQLAGLNIRALPLEQELGCTRAPLPRPSPPRPARFGAATACLRHRLAVHGIRQPVAVPHHDSKQRQDSRQHRRQPEAQGILRGLSQQQHQGQQRRGQGESDFSKKFCVA